MEVKRSRKILYEITSDCIACAECLEVCEEQAIEEWKDIYKITEACVNCGICALVCPVGAIVKID
jgi:Fe-S-cluster-containing hydrogenase component 2